MQILQDRPRTLRQDALSGLGSAIGAGIENFSNAYQKGMETKRQQALKDQEEKVRKEEKDRDYALQKQKFDAEIGKIRSEAKELNRPFQETRKYQEAAALADLKKTGAKPYQPKQNEFAAAGYSKRGRQALSEYGTIPSDTGTGAFSGLAKMLPNALVPDNLQKLDQIKRNFISANLRKESGASISDTEYDNEDKKYFPQPGDSDEVIAQKGRSREQALLNLEGEGRNALPMIGDAPMSGLSQNSIALKPASFRGQQPGVRYSPTNIPNMSPIQSANASGLKVKPQHVEAVKSMSDQDLVNYLNGKR